jgi:hypothetical protein
MKQWALLTPLYDDLDMVKLNIIDNRKQLVDTITQLQELEHGVLIGTSTDDDEWEFMDASWNSAQLSQASKGHSELWRY